MDVDGEGVYCRRPIEGDDDEWAERNWNMMGWMDECE